MSANVNANDLKVDTSESSQVAVAAPSASAQPVSQAEDTSSTFHSCTWLMALVNALGEATDAQYAQQSADANTLMMNQNYQANIATSWNTVITSYITEHTKKDGGMDSTDVAKVNQMQTEMSTEGNKADSTTRSSQSVLETDVNNLARITELLSGATTITSFTANCLRS